MGPQGTPYGPIAQPGGLLIFVVLRSGPEIARQVSTVGVA